MLSTLFSLFMGISGTTLADLPPAEVEQIASQVIAELSGEHVNKPTLLVTERPEPTPLGAISYLNGSCKMIINTNKSAWSQWSRFLNEENRPHWKSIIAASVAHEMGHCMQESKSGPQQVRLSEETLNALGSVGRQSVAMSTRVLKQELFADTVAVLYAKQFMSDDEFTTTLGSMLSAREKFGHDDPTHDTYRELSAVSSQDLTLQTGETLGQAALRLLSKGTSTDLKADSVALVR